MSDILQAFIQTAIVSAIFIYIGKTMLDRLVKRSEEYEKQKERQIELNVSRVEKSNERAMQELKETQKNIQEMKLQLVKVQHMVEAMKEKGDTTNEEFQRFVAYADKVMKDIERSQVIELSKRLQMILLKKQS